MVFLLTLLLTLSLPADTLETYRVYTGDGESADLEAIVAAADTVDVVFLGERHNDAVAHALQDTLFRRLHVQLGDERPLSLSLEMFSRDVQYIVDEYLSGHITEEYFLQSTRPWTNYRSDYRPLVEYAREHNLAVVAANAPRRYANVVSRRGRSSLDTLSARAREALAPVPYPEPSEAYAEKWRQAMEHMPGHEEDDEEAPADTLDHQEQSERTAHAADTTDHFLDAQVLWDATMAYSMAEQLLRYPGSLVVHVTGSFHVEDGLGTPEMLQRYRPGTRSLVVVMRPVEDMDHFDERLHGGLGDFVILTDADVPPSF